MWEFNEYYAFHVKSLIHIKQFTASMKYNIYKTFAMPLVPFPRPSTRVASIKKFTKLPKLIKRLTQVSSSQNKFRIFQSARDDSSGTATFPFIHVKADFFRRKRMCERLGLFGSHITASSISSWQFHRFSSSRQRNFWVCKFKSSDKEFMSTLVQVLLFVKRFWCEQFHMSIDIIRESKSSRRFGNKTNLHNFVFGLES